MADPIKPIRILLSCPFCGTLHVDRGEWAVRPHREHLCERCGLIWMPCLEPTVGVDALCEHEWITRHWYDPQLGVRRGRYCQRCQQSHPDPGAEPVKAPRFADVAQTASTRVAEISSRNSAEIPAPPRVSENQA